MKMKLLPGLCLLFAALLSGCGGKSETQENKTDSAAVKGDSANQKKADGPEEQSPQLKAHLERLHEEWKEVPLNLKLRFVNAEMGDYFHLVFEDEKGRSLDFGDGANNLAGVELYNEAFEPNPAMIGKTFIVTWEWKEAPFMCCEGEMESVRASVPSITQIKLADK